MFQHFSCKIIPLFSVLILAFLWKGEVLGMEVEAGGSGTTIASYHKAKELFDFTSVLEDPQYRPVLKVLGFTDQQLPVMKRNGKPYTAHENDGELENTEGEHLIDIEKGSLIDEDMLNQVIVGCFMKNRRKMYGKALITELCKNLTCPVTFAGTIPIANLLAGGWNMYSTGVSFLSVGILSSSLPSILPLAKGLITTSGDPLFEYEREYAEKKLAINFLDMENDLREKRAPFAEQQFTVARRSAYSLESMGRFFDTLLRIPTKSVRPQLNEEQLKESLNLYSDQTSRIILQACRNHQAAFRSVLGINPQNREFLNLVSAPGTGKSTLVKYIAKSMGLPMATISLAGASQERLFGSDTSAGLFLEKFNEIGARNGILFFDELDRVLEEETLLGILLPFLEPSGKDYCSPYLRRTIDMSHLLIIVAGNLDFNDPSVQSRFHRLKTTDLSIVNKDLMLSLVFSSYFPTRSNDTIIDSRWKKLVEDYLEKQSHLSFRDAQSALDRLIGAKRGGHSDEIDKTITELEAAEIVDPTPKEKEGKKKK
ncbi:MAG: ATP-dependent protease La [uncultured bacterium]|nr:MAG: ATP-dependent protease La [uncultured bacterium]OFW69756.1 MAG: hypothetical protein A2X70_03325 [Alphaproteobacteria bacterium GWC2_42_16]OFW74356.1 MAG: hypothetical protein A2Z80_04965 [Alphaproteobacteria bacterium GWA2_41_27]OFW82077.1 MAG: hypothetical protein A3E50_06395 [Alphaproteobacteria bacterium RIFCSPHIGHO2_12_FULL_42_100]OFW85134.1 MAG: hypothetical protein A2W06_03945 [Alphaproteobacteria bacterium RBG_16_42_14]OFW92508.1 MAG: hypothetical protein A2W46_07215 [Alphaprot